MPLYQRYGDGFKGSDMFNKSHFSGAIRAANAINKNSIDLCEGDSISCQHYWVSFFRLFSSDFPAIFRLFPAIFGYFRLLPAISGYFRR